MANRWGKKWKVTGFIFLGHKIIVDGDCSHAIKRHLLLGRNTMTNLESILKSRDITLPTKVHLVKATVFPLVIYGCESGTIKRAECWRIDAFELWCCRRLLDCKEIKPVNLKEISPESSLEGLMLEAEDPITLATWCEELTTFYRERAPGDKRVTWACALWATHNPGGNKPLPLASLVSWYGTYPGEDWQIDFTQMLSFQGFNYLLVFIDTFGGFLHS